MATREPQQRDTEQHENMGMEQMAENVERHHETPMTGSADLLPNPFPPVVFHGLWIGAVAGALLGLIVAWLLFNNIIVMDGWEQLYSIGDFSFYTFWMVIGLALGVITGGIGAILAAPANQPDVEDRQRRAELVEPDERRREAATPPTRRRRRTPA